MTVSSLSAWRPGVHHARAVMAVMVLLVGPTLVASSVPVGPPDSIAAKSAALPPATHKAEPVQPAAPEYLHLQPSVPVRLSLPSIGVESDLMELGLTSTGALEVPPTAYPAGWYSGAPTPGEAGPAIIAGHVDWASDVGVFHDLHTLVPGDEVLIERADGSTAVFLVDTVEQFAKNAFPTATVYGNIDHAGLRLITCGGEFDWDVVSHRDNIVVFATLDRVVDGS